MKKILIMLFLFLSVSGCVKSIGMGVPMGEIDKFHSNYKIEFNDVNGNKKWIFIEKNIGMCGGGVTISILPIPFIWPKSVNKCEKEGFKIKVLFSPNYGKKDIYLRYNGITHSARYKEYSITKGIDKEKKQIITLNKPEKHFSPYPVFEIKNFKEFKKAKDKTIIVMEDGKVIREIPFEWKLVIIL
jgi:hypothetical protein